MNYITDADIAHHILGDGGKDDGCGRCSHLKGQVGEFSKELLQKAIIAAHSKKRVKA